MESVAHEPLFFVCGECKRRLVGSDVPKILRKRAPRCANEVRKFAPLAFPSHPVFPSSLPLFPFFHRLRAFVTSSNGHTGD